MARILIDQQLPRALARHMATRGHDAKHVKEYPGGERLSDAEIAEVADAEGRIVVTKDEDFLLLHLLSRRPARLVHVTCGNISTRDLLAPIDQHYIQLDVALATCTYLELGRSGVIIRGPA